MRMAVIVAVGLVVPVMAMIVRAEGLDERCAKRRWLRGRMAVLVTMRMVVMRMIMMISVVMIVAVRPTMIVWVRMRVAVAL